MAETTPSNRDVRSSPPSESGSGAGSPPGLSLRGPTVFGALAIGAWGLATLFAPWLAPRITVLADHAESALGVELVPQEMDR